jgi:hypothetical protein
VQVGARTLEYTAEEMVERGLASNCFASANDPNLATHRATAICRPQREMTETTTGRRVIDTSKVVHANLSVCDVSEVAMPQILEDLRKVAAHNAAKNGYQVDHHDHFACKFAVMPQI